MRILFTFVGGLGHGEPLLPIARAAGAAGHAVRVACAAPMVTALAGMGFTAVPLGEGPPPKDDPPARVPLQPLDADREDRVLRDRFAGELASERAIGVLAHCDEWHPDVIVCDEVDRVPHPRHRVQRRVRRPLRACPRGHPRHAGGHRRHRRAARRS